MLHINIKNETSRLKAVILGTADSNGPAPSADEAYDPKSLEHILAGTYPKNKDLVREIESVAAILSRYDIEVYRPKKIEDYNQIFSRDIAFVIDDIFIKANILPDREKELKAIDYITAKISPDKMTTPPENTHIEGGDVILWNGHIFIGTYLGDDYSRLKTARTNPEGVHFIKELFPHYEVKAFDLVKSDTDPRHNALHLDCCFQPVGKDKAIVFKGGFRDEKDYLYLEGLFGLENLFQVTREEMYHMYCNVFSIAPDVVISERNFKRLNDWLRSQGFTVEEVPYAEVAKQEGLLRCSTLPLVRD